MSKPPIHILIIAKLGDHQRAMNDYDTSIKLDPYYPYAYINRGNTYAEFRLYQKAIENFDKAIEADPYKARAYYNKGVVLRNSGQMDLAAKEFQRACELDQQYC